jgi:predicted aspartyl protease
MARRRRIGSFYVDCEVASVRATERATVPRMLVDDRSTSTWVPREVLERLGIERAKRDVVLRMADGRTLTRSIGFAVLKAGELETVDEVVFAEPGDLPRLGTRALAGFGVRVDRRGRRLVPAGPRLAALSA